MQSSHLEVNLPPVVPVLLQQESYTSLLRDGFVGDESVGKGRDEGGRAVGLGGAMASIVSSPSLQSGGTA